MKLTFIFTILIIIISVDCGLVKQFAGKVKEDVHTVVEGTVSIIGKGTHTITEGLGLFLHRNEGNRFPGTKTTASTNQISNDEKRDMNSNGATDNEHEENSGGNDDLAQNYNHIKSTPTTISIMKEHSSNSDNNKLVPENIQHTEPTTESNYHKHPEHESNSDKENIIQNQATTTATKAGTTTDTPWFNGAELENILPTITHNETDFTGDTNDLGTGEQNSTTETESSKAKCDENIKPAESNENKANLVSDQMFFKDNKPKQNDNSHYVCAEGLVRTANGECRQQVEIDVRKKVEPMVAYVFGADSCASGYARALDGSCQKIVG